MPSSQLDTQVWNTEEETQKTKYLYLEVTGKSIICWFATAALRSHHSVA